MILEKGDYMLSNLKFIAALTVVLSANAWAGDNGGGTITCKSTSGRTSVSGGAGAPWNGEGPASLTYTIDGASLNFNPGPVLPSGAMLVDFVAYRNGVSYEVMIKRVRVYHDSGSDYAGSMPIFHMRSKPGSMHSAGMNKWSFVGVIPAYSSLDPRRGSSADLSEDRFDKDIEVNCLLDVGI